MFIAPGIGGDIVGFGHLVRQLDPAQSVYGLRSIGLQEGEEPLIGVPAIAAAFISEMYRIQPAGPYQLFGVCWGGLVALEIARQLTDAGHEVALLALLDPPPVGFDDSAAPATPARAAVPSTRQFLRQRLALYRHSLSTTPVHQWPGYVWQRLCNVFDALRQRDPLRGDATEFLRWRVREANLQAMRSYRPPAFRGEACLLFTSDRPDGRSKAAREYWLQHFNHAGQPQFVPGKDSGDALAPERAAAVAAVLRQRLA
ncbi:MAG: thioesterase domain-containing protein [Gammaproteobacteria bacterium]